MLVEIHVPKFEVFNPRKGLKSTAWFRLNNDFWRSHDFLELDAAQMFLLVTILSICSEKMSDTVSISVEALEFHLKMKKSKILETLKIYEEKQVVRVCNTDVTPTSHACNHTDITDRQTNNNAQRAQFEFDAEALYWEYPRHVAKGNFLKKLRKLITSQKKLDEFKLALGNYQKYITENSIESKFIKYPTTFLSEWSDWLDPENGNVVFMKSKGTKKESDWDLSGVE